MVITSGPQLLLQQVLFQTQQYGNARVTKPHEYKDEVPTNYVKTTCCDILPSSGDTSVCYCYAAPVVTACRVYRSYC